MSSPQQPRPWDIDPQHTRPIYSQPGYTAEPTAPPVPNVPSPPAYVTPHPVYMTPPPQPPRSLAWMWVLLGVLALGLLGIIGYIWMWPMIVNDTSANQAADETHTMVIPAPQVPGPTPAQGGGGDVVPAYSTRCASVFPSTEFPNSAVGSNVTSCEFSEEVRFEYVSQPQRGGTVTVNALSPVTGQTYTMTCSGSDVVTCTGGNNAVVYVY